MTICRKSLLSILNLDFCIAVCMNINLFKTSTLSVSVELSCLRHILFKIRDIFSIPTHPFYLLLNLSTNRFSFIPFHIFIDTQATATNTTTTTIIPTFTGIILIFSFYQRNYFLFESTRIVISYRTPLPSSYPLSSLLFKIKALI